MSAIDQDHPLSRDKYVKQLLDGHRHRAYVLPAAVVDAWEAANRAHAVEPPRDPPPPEHVVWDQLVADGVAAFRRGDPLPDAPAALAARRAAEQGFLQAEKLRREVTAALERFLVDLVTAEKETIILHSLRPALAEVVEELAEVVKVLPEGATEAESLRGSERVRRMWLRAEGLADRYGHLRRAWYSLRPEPGLDARSEFAEMRNLNSPGLWPQPEHRNIPQANQAPWPQKEPERLLWIARHGGQLWVPTDAERDKAYREHYREQLAAQAANRRSADAFRAVFAS